jgi:hypothetical protein
VHDEPRPAQTADSGGPHAAPKDKSSNQRIAFQGCVQRH